MYTAASSSFPSRNDFRSYVAGAEQTVESAVDARVEMRSDSAREPRLETANGIIVCLDRSPFAEACLPAALSLAATFKSAITLVHVMHAPQEAAHLTITDAVGWEIRRQEARAYLERIQHLLEAEGSVTVRLRVEQGKPAERIADLAKEISVDFLVLASLGESGSSARNLGSTVREVISQVHTSVFIAHASPGPEKQKPLRRILVPVDGSQRTESAVFTAARIAAANGAELLLVHVVAEPVANAVLRADEDLELARKLAGQLELGAARYLNRLHEQLADSVKEVRTKVVRHINDRQCILEMAAKEEVDLIVVAAHGAVRDPARAFGGLAADLMSRSPVSILALQDVRDPQPGDEAGAGSGHPAPLRVRESVEEA